MKHILEFDSLDLAFGLRKVLSNVHMKCSTGEIVGLLGRNGSGKTCLMKIVFGSMQAEYKSVRIDGLPYAGNRPFKKRVSYLPQQSFMPPFLTVRESLKVYGIAEEELLATFPEYAEFMDLKPHQLSGGYCRLLESDAGPENAILVFHSR